MATHGEDRVRSRCLQRRGRIGGTLFLGVILALSLGLSVSAWGQMQSTTAVTGTVTDSSGAVVPGVNITVRSDETGAVRETITNEAGYYSVQSLRPGKYSVTAAIPGFKTSIVRGREVQVSIPAAINFVLEVGDIKQEVTVSAEGQELLNTTTPTLSTTINEKLVEKLPNQTRNFFDLVSLSPNTAPQYMGSGQLSYGAHSMRRVNAANSYESSGVFVAGTDSNATNVSIDGGNVQMSIYNMAVMIQSPSTIKELRIETASGNAEFGDGSNYINVITKNGTNDFHGELLWQHRNDNLDANNFFTNLAGRGLPEYKRNKFGGSLGGPIVRDKLHFFGNYEGSRLRQATQSNAIVPTAAMRSGDFSAYRPLLAGAVLGPTPTIYNPYDYDAATGLRKAFPGNKIPASLLDPAMQTFLKYTALPNTVIDGVPQYSGLIPTFINENQYSARIDYERSTSTSFYGRYTYGEREAVRGGLLGTLAGESTPSSAHTAVFHWLQVHGPTKVNDFSLTGALRMKSGIGRRLDVPDVTAEMGLKNSTTLPGAPVVSQPDFSTDNSSLYVWDPTQDTYQLRDDFSWNKGKHSFKLGFNLTERRMFFVKQSNDKGLLYFSNYYARACPLGNTTCEQAATAAGLAMGGLAFADLLMGAASYENIQNVAVSWHGHQRYYGGYFQDAWQATPRLTLNLGLRYERWKPWLMPRNSAVRYNFSGNGSLEYALQNPLDVFNPATDYGRNAPLNPNMPREGYETDTLNFAPRVGFAYMVNLNTTIRAGGGIFYANNVNQDQFGDAQIGADPFIISSTQSVAGSEQLPPLAVGKMFPAPAPGGIPTAGQNPPAAPRALGDKVYHSPTVYQWSLSVNRRISEYWSASLDYLGSRTVHNQQFVDLNSPAVPQGSLANLSLQDRRRLPLWGAWLTWVNWGWAKHHGGTFSLKNRQWHGLSLLSSFQWAKTMSSSAYPGNDQNNYDYRNWDLWRGKYLLTPDYRFVNAWSYRLPVGKGQRYALRGVADTILGGWNISGIAEFMSGAPVTLRASDNSGTGLGIQHPDRVSGCDVNDATRDRFQWFNTKCFVNPTYGTWGNAGQGIINDPGMNNWNMTFGKDFKIREQHSIELRCETFNTFNHTQWQASTTNLASSSFGRIGSARPARQIQFSLLYRF